jgi:iron complex outermembrane receptor protein
MLGQCKKSHLLGRLLLLAQFSVLPCFVYADELEEDIIDLEILNELSLEALYELPFVEIATGTAVPLEQAPSVATLITARDIKSMGATTLTQVLESVPGLHVSASNLTSLNVLSIRGIKTSFTPQVLVLINGYRISSDLNSGALVTGSIINVENISRIEIIRGSGSAIYGADAFSGVINIITKSAKDISGFALGMRAGSDNMKNIWAQYGNALGNGW